MPLRTVEAGFFSSVFGDSAYIKNADPVTENSVPAANNLQNITLLQANVSSALILEDKDIDAVIIATPPETHFEIAKKAMELGKHVFVEKPITTDVKDAEKLVDLAASKKRVLMVGHVFLYTGAVKKIKEIIESGDIGKILHIRSTRLNLGLFESGKDVVWNIKRGKNVIWDFMPHDISLILYLLGNKTPKKIVATGNAHIEKGIEDTVFVNLIFDDGVNATISASWLDAVKVREFTIIGSKKMIVFDDV